MFFFRPDGLSPNFTPYVYCTLETLNLPSWFFFSVEFVALKVRERKFEASTDVPSAEQYSIRRWQKNNNV